MESASMQGEGNESLRRETVDLKGEPTSPAGAVVHFERSRSRAYSAEPSSTVVTPATLNRRAEEVIRSLLGGQLPTDPKAVLGALSRAFPEEQSAAQPGSDYSSSSSIAGGRPTIGLSVTQANLYVRARTALADCTARLRALKPLKARADPENVEILRQVVLIAFTSLVEELGRAGGPIGERVDLFFNVLGTKDTPATLIGGVKEQFGFEEKHARTAEEWDAWLDFNVISSTLSQLRANWEEVRKQHEASPFTNMSRLLRTFSALEKAVGEVEQAMDAAGFDAIEREQPPLDALVAAAPRQPPDVKTSDLTVSQVLEWIRTVAASEGPQLIRVGGRVTAGVMHTLLKTVNEVAKRLETLALGDEVKEAVSRMLNLLSSAEGLANAIKQGPY